MTIHVLMPPAITLEGELICTYEEHFHTEDCYEIQEKLICQIEETTAHVHEQGCYEDISNLMCEQPETIPHIHGETCYDEDENLNCEEIQDVVHTHEESCYANSQNLTCTLQETVHLHEDACYEEKITLLCTLNEHLHTEACYLVNQEPNEEMSSPIPETPDIEDETIEDETEENNTEVQYEELRVRSTFIGLEDVQAAAVLESLQIDVTKGSEEVPYLIMTHENPEGQYEYNDISFEEWPGCEWTLQTVKEESYTVSQAEDSFQLQDQDCTSIMIESTTEEGYPQIEFYNFYTPKETGAIAIMNKDSTTESGNVQGVELSLKNPDGNVIKTLTSSENGFLYFNGIEKGTYTLEQTVTPEGYSRSFEQKNVEVNQDTDGVRVSVDGAVYYDAGEISDGYVLYHTPGSDDTEGQEEEKDLEIPEEEKESEILEDITGQETNILTPSINQEIKPVLEKEVMATEANAVQSDNIISSEPEPEEIDYETYELPKTGGMGSTLFYPGGILMMTCAGILLRKRKA